MVEYPLYEMLWAPNAFGFHFLFFQIYSICIDMRYTENRVKSKHIPIHVPYLLSHAQPDS